MTHILSIALVTYREAVRNRVLYSLLFFVVALFLVAAVLDSMTTGQSGRIVLDMGLSGIHLFGVLITVFLAVSAMAREMTRKTVYVVLAKPVSRTRFLLGKYIGLVLTLVVLVALMGLALLLMTLLLGDLPGMAALYAVGMIWVELAVLSAVAMLFCTFTGPFLSGMFVLGVFVIGHLTSGLLTMAQETGDGMMIAMARAVYYLFPNLESFNFKAQALYSTPLSALDTGLVLLYAVAYATAMLAGAAKLFAQRDFR